MSKKGKEKSPGCSVCSDEQVTPENPIIQCDGKACKVSVHKACYGIQKVPEGAWFCRKCESQERVARMKCELCPSKEGALKRTDKGAWCHVVCALFIPEADFVNSSTMEPINLDRIPQERNGKVCFLCEKGNRSDKATYGSCMTCNKPGCRMTFHVTCAFPEGMLVEEKEHRSKLTSYVGYCPQHLKKSSKSRGFGIRPPPPATIQQKESPTETVEKTPKGKIVTSPNLPSTSASDANPTSPPTITPAKDGDTTPHEPLTVTVPADVASIPTASASVASEISQKSDVAGKTVSTPGNEDTTSPSKEDTQSVNLKRKATGSPRGRGRKRGSGRMGPSPTLDSTAAKKKAELNSAIVNRINRDKAASNASGASKQASAPKKGRPRRTSFTIPGIPELVLPGGVKPGSTPPPTLELSVPFPEIASSLPVPPPRPRRFTAADLERPSTSTAGGANMTMEELLEWQWDQAGGFLMQQEQAENTDIVSLLSCLHQLKKENDDLESKSISLEKRKKHLLSVNARLREGLTTVTETEQADLQTAQSQLHEQSPHQMQATQALSSQVAPSVQASFPPHLLPQQTLTSTPQTAPTPGLDAVLQAAVGARNTQQIFRGQGFPTSMSVGLSPRHQGQDPGSSIIDPRSCSRGSNVSLPSAGLASPIGTRVEVIANPMVSPERPSVMSISSGTGGFSYSTQDVSGVQRQIYQQMQYQQQMVQQQLVQQQHQQFFQHQQQPQLVKGQLQQMTSPQQQVVQQQQKHQMSLPQQQVVQQQQKHQMSSPQQQQHKQQITSPQQQVVQQQQIHQMSSSQQQIVQQQQHKQQMTSMQQPVVQQQHKQQMTSPQQQVVQQQQKHQTPSPQQQVVQHLHLQQMTSTQQPVVQQQQKHPISSPQQQVVQQHLQQHFIQQQQQQQLIPQEQIVSQQQQLLQLERMNSWPQTQMSNGRRFQTAGVAASSASANVSPRFQPYVPGSSSSVLVATSSPNLVTTQQGLSGQRLVSGNEVGAFPPVQAITALPLATLRNHQP